MTAPRTIGTIVPSSNTIVERITHAILAGRTDVSAHFARIPFAGNKVHLSHEHDIDAMFQAARTLADARMDVIYWNGSKAAGIAFDLDRNLCRKISEAVGVPATTSVLALDAVLKRNGVQKIAIATPFLGEYQAKLKATLANEGYEVVADEKLDIADNFEISLIPERIIAGQVQRLAKSRPSSILIICTNYNGAPIAAEMERETGIPVYDSVSVGLWHALRLAGIDTSSLATRWGSLFAAGL
jgi:maleate isomerase